MAIELNKYHSEVTRINQYNEGINHLIIIANKLNCLSPTLISPYIPIKYSLRNTFTFQCLLNIKITPNLTKSAYANKYNKCKQSTSKAINYLKELGLIIEIGKPRLIIPFQRYKIDKAYKLTYKGNKVIKEVFSVAGLV